MPIPAEWLRLSDAQREIRQRNAQAAKVGGVDARRTARRNAELAAGVHPTTKRPLLGENRDGDGHTCGDCNHHVQNGRFHKCSLVPLTHGPATDVRLRWPACTGWGTQPEDG